MNAVINKIPKEGCISELDMLTGSFSIAKNDYTTVVIIYPPHEMGDEDSFLGAGTFFTALSFPHALRGTYYQEYAGSGVELGGIVQNFLDNPIDPPSYWDAKETVKQTMRTPFEGGEVPRVS